MQTCTSLLYDLCDGPPDGRPLYAYRISDEDYARLRVHLVEHLRTADPKRLRPSRCALFCLFVAEQSRRDPQQAGRTWTPVHQALGTGDIPYADLITWVVKGMRELERPIQRTEHQRLFRVTLGCEGGLALERLATDSEGGQRLRCFFRLLLTRLAVFDRSGCESEEVLTDDARRVAERGGRLPKGLQNEVVYTLAGRLAGTVWSFRRLVRGQDDPVQALDQRHPEWRDELPVVLSGDAAEAFVHGLMEDTGTLAEGSGFDLEVRTEILLGARPRLVRTLRAPRELSAAQVREAFPDLPAERRAQRFAVRVRSEAGDHSRVGVLRENSDASWTFQPQTDQVSPADLGGAIQVELASRRHPPVSGRGISGCDELGPLPWIFQDQEHGRLIGTGSVRHTDETLIVALPSEADVDGGSVEPVSSEVAGRRLIRVRGTVRVTLDGDVVMIRTTTPREGGLYELRGRLLEGLQSSRPVWRGLPSLVRRSPARTEAVDADVRAIQGQLDPPAGDLEIRLADEHGELLFKRRVRVVPEDTRIAMTRIGRGLAPGILLVSARGLREVGAPVEPPMTATVEGTPTGERHIHYAANSNTPPTRAPLTLDFASGTVTGTVVLPLRTLRFEDLDGQPVPPNHAIHVRHLGRYRAIGVSPRHNPRIQVTLKLVGTTLATRRRTRLLRPTRTQGSHQLDLREINQLVLDLLHQTPALDASVQISLEELGEAMQRPARLSVHRYDWNVQVDRKQGDVCLTDDIDDSTLANVSVQARPFADIRQVIHLARLRSTALKRPTWTFEPTRQAPGAYLLLVSDDGWFRCRPTILVGRGPGQDPSQGLAGALQIPDNGQRLEAIRECVRQLCADPEHPDWGLVHDYLALIGDIPPATFDLVRVIAESRAAPACCAVRLASGKEAEFLVAWDGLEALGVLWEAVPVDAWWDALDQLGQRLQDLPGASRTEVVVSTVLDRLQTELGTMGVIAEAWRNGRFLRFPVRAGLQNRDEEIAKARQRLADADWPRAPDEHFHVDPAWRSDVEAGHADMRVGLLATTALAQSAVFDRPLSRSQRLYLAELRALDETFFRESTFFATCALLAARTQAS